MTTASVIAAILHSHGVRIDRDESHVLLTDAARAHKNEIVSAYRELCGGDVEVTLNFSQLYDASHNALQLMYDTAYEDLISYSGDVDDELWLLQNDKESRHDERVIHLAQVKADRRIAAGTWGMP